MPPLVSDLEVIKSATSNDVVQPGAVVRWTIEITNTGATTFDDVVLGDDLPDLTSYLRGTTQVDGETIDDDGTLPLADGVQVGPLAPGESVVASFDTEVLTAPDGALIKNTAVVASTNLTTSIASNVVEVVVGQDLPDTGAGPAGTIVGIAAGLLGLGLLLLAVARRRDEDEDLAPA